MPCYERVHCDSQRRSVATGGLGRNQTLHVGLSLSSFALASPISAMRTAGPATRPALALREIFNGSLDVSSTRFQLFRRSHPADPFVARQRRDVLPGGERLRRCEEGGL